MLYEVITCSNIAFRFAFLGGTHKKLFDIAEDIVALGGRQLFKVRTELLFILLFIHSALLICVITSYSIHYTKLYDGVIVLIHRFLEFLVVV